MIAALLLGAARCFSPEPIPQATEQAWQKLFDYSRGQYVRNHDEYERSYAKESAEISAGQRVSSRTRRSYRNPGILAANSVNAIDIASAAIDTSVEGVQAGVTVAPLLLAGIASKGQVKLTLAALEEGKTRLATAFSYEQGPDLETYADLGLEPCPRRTSAFEKALEERECAFERVCTLLVAKLPEPGGPSVPEDVLAGLSNAKSLCGLAPGLAPVRADIAGAAVVKARDDLRKHYQSADRDRAAFLDALADREKDDLATISAFLPDDLDACHRDVIGDVYARRVWEEPKTSIGLQYTVDLFPLTFGSDDPAATHGQPARHDLRFEFDYSKGPLALTAGLGYGSERSFVGAPFQLLVRPSVEASFVAFAIGGESLRTRAGRGNFVDGALVPHVAIGLSVAEENKGDFSATTSAVITPYVAFVFSERIVVRAGIPVTATRVCTKTALVQDAACDPLQAPAGATALQWTVPASVVTILKM